MVKLKAVIFDLDGTLLNTLDDLRNAANTICQEYQWPTYSLETFRYFVGNGIPKMVERLIPQKKLTETLLAEVICEFKQEYQQHLCDATRPYDGIREMLEKLEEEGIKIAVLTNKADELAKQIVRTFFGKNDWVVWGQRPGIKIKPHPQALLLLLDQLRVDKKNALYVGDSAVDIETARAALVKDVGVLWGFRNKEELQEAGVTILVETPEQLVDFILTKE